MPEVDVFSALANPVRRDLLERLRDGPRRAGDLAQDLAHDFAIGRPAVSEHLRVLRRAGLVRERPEGRQRFYHLDPRPLHEIELWTAAFTRYWDARLDDLERLLDEGIDR